ncbi:hypothetical protein QQF64_013968, partial [Cirrhinus molitorella]
MLISPSALQDPGDGAKLEDISMDCTDGEDELCLEEILTLYSQPINEEQAWAVCYQCCRWLTQKQRRKETGGSPPGRIVGPGDVRIRKDGTVKLYQPSSPDKHIPPSSSIEEVHSQRGLGPRSSSVSKVGLSDLLMGVSLSYRSFVL